MLRWSTSPDWLRKQLIFSRTCMSQTECNPEIKNSPRSLQVSPLQFVNLKLSSDFQKLSLESTCRLKSSSNMLKRLTDFSRFQLSMLPKLVWTLRMLTLPLKWCPWLEKSRKLSSDVLLSEPRSHTPSCTKRWCRDLKTLKLSIM